jgi:hypothetical protein
MNDERNHNLYELERQYHRYSYSDMKDFVYKLADPALEGRRPGTRGHQLAQTLIISAFESLRLTPLIDDESYKQKFIVPADDLDKQHLGDDVHEMTEFHCANLLAYKPAENIHAKEWVLLGAHYDHRIIQKATEKYNVHFKSSSVYSPGATDNAASVGILLQTMKEIMHKQYHFHIVVAIFDTEEYPFFAAQKQTKLWMGSQYFYHNMPERLHIDNLKCAIVLDTIGHDTVVKGRENSIFAFGMESGSQFYEFTKHAAKMSSIDAYCFQKTLRLSDHIPFYLHDNPHIFLTSGMSYRYHSDADTVESLSYDKMNRLVSMMEKLIDQFSWKIISQETDSSSENNKDIPEIERFLGMTFSKKKNRNRSFGNIYRLLLYMNAVMLNFTHESKEFLEIEELIDQANDKHLSRSNHRVMEITIKENNYLPLL